MHGIDRPNCCANAAFHHTLRITVLPAYLRECSYLHSRKGFDGLSALVQTALKENPYSGQIFVFRGRPLSISR